MKLDKKENRLRRARKGRAKIRELEVNRLSVHRTPRHIYAQIIAPDGGTVLVSASTIEQEVRKGVKAGGNVEAASIVGARIAEKAKAAAQRAKAEAERAEAEAEKKRKKAEAEAKRRAKGAKRVKRV